MGFPSKVAQIIGVLLQNKLPGILHRIQRKWSQAGQNRPWVSHARGQDDGSLHNPPQMIIIIIIIIITIIITILGGSRHQEQA